MEFRHSTDRLFWFSECAQIWMSAYEPMQELISSGKFIVLGNYIY